ncbi:acetyl- acetyltransferase [Ophiostoma piceae UAMH 11346]|uniref:Acetyl-acetyltransferase n=1 Tax=Ophiostoma piceae (strain UAMH 11346) TaxID=1262450 RepID=S3CUM0_OPHP1|nr:acetyl- acetyltransferase [Ophiostoma piceae UAMH 11346]
MAPNTPIIVGVGEVREKKIDPKHTTEPAGLMLAAIRQAAADASITEADLEAADDLSVVPPWTMQYPDLPGLLAHKLRSKPAFATIGHHGGEQCALLTDEAARRIARGTSKLAIVTGGEALASLAACQKAGLLPPPGWSAPDPKSKAISTNDLSFNGVTMASRHGMGLAIHVYPMYENGLRAHIKQTQKQNTDESAELYAAFDKVACAHPASWRAGETPRDAKAVGEVTPENRLICSPYPLLQNAFNTVNLSAAIIMTSVAHATKLGIPQSKWVYPLSGAGTNDKETFYERNNFYSSQSLEQSIDATIQQSGIAKGDIDCFDFYSCFPIVPKLACHHLGLSVINPEKPITLLGGLTSFGGAGNNYSMHAMVEMARRIRRGMAQNGMVVANGGVLTHHYSLIFSTSPRSSSLVYPMNPLPSDMEVRFVPPLEEVAEGAATLETYTVVYDRSGNPAIAHIVARLDRTGSRFVANSSDVATLAYLADPSVEPVGAHGTVRQQDGKNAFYIGPSARL